MKTTHDLATDDRPSWCLRSKRSCSSTRRRSTQRILRRSASRCVEAVSGSSACVCAYTTRRCQPLSAPSNVVYISPVIRGVVADGASRLEGRTALAPDSRPTNLFRVLCGGGVIVVIARDGPRPARTARASPRARVSCSRSKTIPRPRPPPSPPRPSRRRPRRRQPRRRRRRTRASTRCSPQGSPAGRRNRM